MSPPAEDAAVDRRKIDLRARARRARGEIPPEVRAAASADAIARLVALPELADADTVAIYAATADELDVTGAGRILRERGAVVLFPRVAGDRLLLVATTDDASLRAGYRSILEPDGPTADLDHLDAIVVPGVAFDAAGRRLGRGGGHYDRLLAELPETTVRIGACFEVQVTDEVPSDAHDRTVDLVVTEETVRRQTSRRRR